MLNYDGIPELEQIPYGALSCGINIVKRTTQSLQKLGVGNMCGEASGIKR